MNGRWSCPVPLFDPLFDQRGSALAQSLATPNFLVAAILPPRRLGGVRERKQALLVTNPLSPPGH